MGKIRDALLAIIAERKELGKLSQRDLAKFMGCTQATVSHMLTGARGLSEKRIEDFCAYLKITLGDLEDPTPKPVEPKPIRDYLKKLKDLYEISTVPGFKNVTRSIDDWLEVARHLESPPVQQPASNVVQGDFSQPSEIKELPGIDYTDPKHEHDAPREEIYEDLPFFDQFRVPAGKPDEVVSDGTVSVRKVVRHLAKGNRYVIRVTGDSMQPRIEDGDLILVDYTREPSSGNVVVAMINGAAVVKKFLRQNGQIILRSANPKYADIEVKETDQFQIAGVVLRIVEGAL
jgi:DNA polymerase V